MPKSIQAKDRRTLGYVLRRTNYGEADRILNVITPDGKVSAIAKSVRKEKSKLAGAVEMFSLIDFNFHFGKTDLATVTGAKMLKFYSNILKDYGKTELASSFLKQINKAAEHSDNPEFFEILDQSLAALNDGVVPSLVESWFWLNLTKALGEEVNLYRDVSGKKLLASERYEWDIAESAFVENPRGKFGADEIKMLRLLITSNLKVVKKIKTGKELKDKILVLARIVAGL